MARRAHDFQTIRSEGGLLPLDLLRRVLDPAEKLEGTRPEDYGHPQGERLNEVITQSWNRLRKHWAEFRVAAANLPEGEPGTGLTNDKWSLPLLRELGFGLLPTSASREIGGRTYAINRFVGPVPIHLVGCGLSLDRRAAGVRGAAAANPHGLVQEFINRSPGHVWAIVANGLRLRVLRDNQALSRQSFLEFDLEAMFAGEVYSDFVLLWLVAHATRFTPREADRPETCWLELWTKLANEQGTRALGDLRIGVEKALQILGEGFTSHSKNTALREVLRKGEVSLVDFHGQLLRVVYRLIFVFVAEDRTLDGQSLLHTRDDSDAARLARERYAGHYSTSRLRELASSIKGSRHGDLWQQFQLLVGALSGDTSFAVAREQLALPALGSFLWDPASTAALNNAELTNYDLLEALRNLAFTRQGKVLRPVDYKNLGSEELGGVYESLLALTPQISSDGARFTFAEFAGSERKTTGAYYTPDSLVQCLLDSALDPVVDDAIRGKSGAEAEKAILTLKICDPAVGSGHFLVGAAHRLARHLARVRALAAGESEPSPLHYQHALRDVIGRCLYAVDLNPMAAELCRVSLWLEALEPGKPLSFLDHHVRVGNSLLGTTPKLIAAGIPDDAFTPIEGDDKKACAALKKRNKQERQGQQDMLHMMVAEPSAEYNSITERRRGIEDTPDNTIDDIQRKAGQFHGLVVSPEYQHAEQVADAWCAAFVWLKEASVAAEPLTTDAIRRLQTNPKALTPAQRSEVERLTMHYQFFHWHLAFPEVFAKGGFDCVLGNPPWERVKLQEQEFFAQRDPAIAAAPNAVARKKDIAALKDTNPALLTAFHEATRQAEGEGHLMRSTGRYPLCGRGDINTYAVFAESMRDALGPTGRLGVIVPTGIATDDTTRFFFSSLVETHCLVSVFSFENEELLFPSVHHASKFCLLTVAGHARPHTEAEFVFLARQPTHLQDKERQFSLTPDDIRLLSPNTLTCKVFRSRRDADLVRRTHRRLHVVDNLREGPSGNIWNLVIRRLLDVNKSDVLAICERTRSDSTAVPLYEGKMLHQFDHRFGTYAGQTVAQANQGKLPEATLAQHNDPSFETAPFYWVSRANADAVLSHHWPHEWLLAWRDITSANLERTVTATILPRVPTDFTVRVGFLHTAEPAIAALFLVAVFNGFVFDYMARLAIGGNHLSDFILRQLPILPPTSMSAPAPWAPQIQLADWFTPRVLELVYTAHDLAGFARDLGRAGPPFRWDEERRFLLRCELDAAFFHLYLPAEVNGNWRLAERETVEDLARLKTSFRTPRDAATYIMDTFPIVRRKDEERWGDYRTKRVILEIYDALAESIRTGQPYQTRLDPPPADPRVAHRPQRQPEPRAVPVLAHTGRVIAFEESRVLRRVRPRRDERYTTCVPRLDLKVAAGKFGDDQRPEFEEWVEVNASQTLRKGMFVARVVGESMEPLIPDGAYCLFQFKAPQLRNDMVGLFQLHTAEDPETGGRFTIKKLKLSTHRDPEDGWRRVTMLVPENPAFEPIPVEGDDVKFVAEFLEVLPPLVGATDKS